MPRSRVEQHLSGLVSDLAREVTDLKRQVKSLQVRPSLRNASIEDTGISVRGADGRVKAIIGRQVDGTHGDRVVESPVQPCPTGVTLTAGTGTIRGRWDGTADGPVPLVFGRLEFLIAPGATESDDDDAPIADIDNAVVASSIYAREGGGTSLTVSAGWWTVWARFVGADGKTIGPACSPQSVRIEEQVDTAAIEERIRRFAEGELEDAAYDNLASRMGSFLVIEGDQVRGNTFEGVEFIGASFASSARSSEGVKLNNEGLLIFDDEGRLTVALDGVSNFLDGELRFGLEGVGEIEVRSYSGNEFRADGDEGDEFIGLGFSHQESDAGIAGIFSSPDSALNIHSGQGRPRALMSGQWAIQDLRVLTSIGDRVTLGLLNGWTSSVRTGPPEYIRVGDMVILRGGVVTPSGGSMSEAVAMLPAPTDPARIAAMISNATATSITSVILEINDSGEMSVLNGGSITQARNLYLDGLIYFTS